MSLDGMDSKSVGLSLSFVCLFHQSVDFSNGLSLSSVGSSNSLDGSLNDLTNSSSGGLSGSLDSLQSLLVSLVCLFQSLSDSMSVLLALSVFD